MDKILVLDFGGQYNQLIARRVRELHVFAEIKAYDRISPAQILEAGYRGIIFTGGPNSVYDPASPIMIPPCWIWGSPSWGSATATSSWLGWPGARSARRPGPANTEKRS